MRIIEHREREFPDDLEGRLNCILNVVNNEFKTLTMLHLDDVPKGCGEIRARIRETVGGGIYLPSDASFSGYCHATLFRIGSVAEEDVVYHEPEGIVTGYKLTEAGKKYGRPIAAFTLKYVAETGRSMHSIFGSTHSYGKSRAPLNRIRILEMLKEGNLRKADLIQNLNLHPLGIFRHLEALKQIGFIDYDSCETKSENFLYEWIGGENYRIKTVKSWPSLTVSVSGALRNLKIASSSQIANILDKDKHPISVVLSGLEKQDLTRKIGKWRALQVQSEARLLDEGRKCLEEYGDRVKDAVSDGDSLAEMNELFEELNRNPEMFREYSRRNVKIYREISPWINRKPVEETQERIIEYLRNNPGKRPSEIRQVFLLSILPSYINPLVKSGKLRKERKGRVTRYYVNE